MLQMQDVHSDRDEKRLFCSVFIHQLQQKGAQVGPRAVRVGSISVRDVNQIKEQPLVDVEVLM